MKGDGLLTAFLQPFRIVAGYRRSRCQIARS